MEGTGTEVGGVMPRSVKVVTEEGKGSTGALTQELDGNAGFVVKVFFSVGGVFLWGACKISGV